MGYEKEAMPAMSLNALRFMRAFRTERVAQEWYAAPFIRTVGAKAGLNEAQAISATGELERLGLVLMNLQGHVRLTARGTHWYSEHGL